MKEQEQTKAAEPSAHADADKQQQQLQQPKIPVLVQLHSKTRTKSNDNNNDNENDFDDNNHDDSDRMDLEVGENWLRLVLRNSNGKHGDNKSILDDTQTQDTSNFFTSRNRDSVPYPSILSGFVQNNTAKDINNNNAKGEEDSCCYLMFDVDDTYKTANGQQQMALTIKDMRAPLTTNGSTNGDEDDDNEEDHRRQRHPQRPVFEICLARCLKGMDESKTKEKSALSLAASSAALSWSDYGPLEELPRRQLRILQPGDRICTRAVSSNDNDNEDDESNNSNDTSNKQHSTLGLILEYRMEVPSSTAASSKAVATQEMPEYTQATNLTGTAMEEDDNDDNMEIEEVSKPNASAATPGSATKLQIQEASSIEDDDDDNNGGADPTLTQPEGGFGQTIESEEEEEKGDDSLGNQKETYSTTPGSSSVAFLATQPQDDGDDSDATEYNVDDNIMVVHEQKTVASSDDKEQSKEKEGSTIEENGKDQKVEKSVVEKEESSEVKTTQETEGSSSKETNEDAKQGNAPASKDDGSGKNITETDKRLAAGNDTDEETTAAVNFDADGTDKNENMAQVPTGTRTAETATSKKGKRKALDKPTTTTASLKDEQVDDDDGSDVTEDLAAETAPQGEKKDSEPNTTAQVDEDATQDVIGATKDTTLDDDATQDMTERSATKGVDVSQDDEGDTKQSPVGDENAIQDANKTNEAASVNGDGDAKQAPSTNETATPSFTSKEIKDVDEDTTHPDAANKENENVRLSEAEGTPADQNIGSEETKSAPSAEGTAGTPERTASKVTVRSESNENRRPVRKYGTKKRNVDVATETVESAYPDSDNSCNEPKKSPKADYKCRKNSDQEDLAKGQDSSTAREQLGGVVKGEAGSERDEPVTPLRQKPGVSPRMDSSQARKIEGASVLASIGEDEVKEDAFSAHEETKKPTKSAARVKRKRLEPVSEFPDEASIDEAVPTANLTLSASSKSPDSGADPTRKSRAKTRKKDKKASPTPAAAPSPTPEPSAMIETPARSTRKCEDAKSVSGRKETVSKRARATPNTSDDSADTNGIGDHSEEIRVVTTGVTLSKTQTNIITKKLGGVLLEDVQDAATATHVIAADKKVSMRRTPKLMIGLCCTSNIVNLDWLTMSGRAKKPLPTEDFLIVDDKIAEEKYNFSMHESLERGKAMRENGEKLLGGFWVHVCKGITGTKAPPEKEMKLIVEVAGGEWLPTLTQKGLEGVKMSRLLIITSDPEVKKQVSTKAIKTALESGARKRTTSWLFGCILKQKLDLPETE